MNIWAQWAHVNCEISFGPIWGILDGDGYSRLIKKIKKYNPNCDFALIEKAHNLSLEAHKGQQRNPAILLLSIPWKLPTYWQISSWIALQ